MHWVLLNRLKSAWLTSDHNIHFLIYNFSNLLVSLSPLTQRLFKPSISHSFSSVVISAASFFNTSKCPTQYELLLRILKINVNVSWYDETLKVDSNRVSEDRHLSVLLNRKRASISVQHLTDQSRLIILKL